MPFVMTIMRFEMAENLIVISSRVILEDIFIMSLILYH
jgi:hypothetical protein